MTGMETDPSPQLLPVEQAILGLLAAGKTNGEITLLLQLTEHVTKVHLQRIYRKLGARRRAQAVALALEQGLLPEPDPDSEQGSEVVS